MLKSQTSRSYSIKYILRSQRITVKSATVISIKSITVYIKAPMKRKFLLDDVKEYLKL